MIGWKKIHSVIQIYPDSEKAMLADRYLYNLYSYKKINKIHFNIVQKFFAAYVDCDESQYKDAVRLTLDQIDVIKRLVNKYPNDLKFVTSAQGIIDAFNEGKIASMIGVEGGHSIDSRSSILRLYYELGVRYLTLTHNCKEPW